MQSSAFLVLPRPINLDGVIFAQPIAVLVTVLMRAILPDGLTKEPKDLKAEVPSPDNR